MALPTSALVLLTLGGAGLIGAGGWLALRLVSPGGAPAAALGAAAAAAGTLVALGAIRPWRSRPRARWPMVVFGAQGLGLVLTIAAAGSLLYFSPPHGPAWLAGACAGTFVTVWILLGKKIGSALGSPTE